MNYTIEKKWDHLQNKCVVLMNHNSGCRCGYVGIDNTHPLYQLNYTDKLPKELLNKWEEVKKGNIGKRGIIDIFCCDVDNPNVGILFDVHGGVTYSGENDYLIKLDKPWWWFGFDCGHIDDAPDIDQMEERVRQVYLQFGFDITGIVRTLEYCINECESLSQQLEDIR